ncbi:MAG TPA: M48 family metallopeptidase [Vicinamibacterales bacterium]
MRTLLLSCLFVLCACAAHAQPQMPRPDPSVVGPEAATEAYLASVPADARARSDAYFEGGYWLILWRFLWSAAGLLVLLGSGLSARLRDLAERATRSVFLQPAIYWVGFSLFTFVFALPLSVYADFFREHQYGLSTQTFGAWIGDSLKLVALDLTIGSIAVCVFYAALRRTGRAWWLWGAGILLAFLVSAAAVAPVFIAPLFNTYTPVQAEAVREPVLAMARANGIAADTVWQMDASRQTTRISANVSGMLGTERITLNDNLLNRASTDAVLAVMGHEIGHYVLNHTYELLLWFGLLTVVGFALVARIFPLAAARRPRWGVRGVTDPAGLPLIVLLFSSYLFVITPVTNSIIRSNEFEADLFGLNAARRPDGFAEAALLLGEYRKLHPGPLEELIFFDHPSGYTRILAAMRFKAEQE